MLTVTSKVVMLVLLIGADGTQTTGVVDFKDYDSCYESLHRDVRQEYVHVERVCMDALLFERAVLTKKKKAIILEGGPKENKKEWF